jgi:hypothetical protein
MMVKAILPTERLASRVKLGSSQQASGWSRQKVTKMEKADITTGPVTFNKLVCRVEVDVRKLLMQNEVVL